ncbi:MAG TPA: TolC family protein [Terriglobia bacterium]|nr:TolC family protein [Terriglobia bacterium]
MKVSRICVTLLVAVGIVTTAAPARAEINTNFVKDFLSRYRPSRTALSAAPATASPQDVASLIRSGQLPLTVGDLINLMLQNNLDIGVNRLTPLSSVYLTETMYRPFEPTLRFQATVGRNTTPATSQLIGAQSLSTLSGNYSVGFAEALPTGTNVGVNFSMNRFSSNSAFNTFNPSYTGLLQYTFSQHLLNGWGRSINTHLVRIAQNNQKISESQFEKQAIDLVAQAERSYWDLVFAADDIKIKQRSMDLAQKTLSDNEIQVRIGTLAPIDLVQAESDLANRRVQYVTSTYTEVQTQDQVKKFITSQSDPGLVLAKLMPSQTVRMPDASDVMPVEQAIKVALENRPEMKQLQLDLQSKKIDIEYTRNQLLPTVDLQASYVQNGVGGIETIRNGFGPTAPIIAQLNGGISNAFGQLFGYGYTGYNVGFSVQIPLRNRAAQGDNARAMTDERSAEQRISSQAQQIALEVRNALTSVDMNKAKIEATTKARELAERRLDAEQKKFDLGASTIRFVLQEQTNVAQSQTDELQAVVNYTKSLVDLNHAMGMTLKKNNIEIEKSLISGASAR